MMRRKLLVFILTVVNGPFIRVNCCNERFWYTLFFHDVARPDVVFCPIND